jgi:glycosyltransferase involved in cell wall biosynthesis
MKFEKNPGKKLYAYLESRKVRQWERKACQLSAAAMACSDHDRLLLEKLHPEATILAAPNVVNVDEYCPQIGDDPQKILFQGGMDWYPNRDAVEYFVSEIYPLIRKEIRGVRFVVAGRNPPEDFRERLSREPGVEFTGTVPDMRKVVADAAVCVIPLRMGSGTRLKILEGGAMAKAMVSTRLGAEGLDFQPGTEIMLEDEPAAFAGSVVRLLRDSTLRKSIGAGARQRVESDYSYSALRTALGSLLDKLQTRSSTQAMEQIR